MPPLPLPLGSYLPPPPEQNKGNRIQASRYWEKGQVGGGGAYPPYVQRPSVSHDPPRTEDTFFGGFFGTWIENEPLSNNRPPTLVRRTPFGQNPVYPRDYQSLDTGGG